MIRHSLVLIFVLSTMSFAQSTKYLDSLFNALLEYKSGHVISSPDGNKPQVHNKCSFGLSAAVRLNISKFTPAQQLIIKKLMDRPSLSNEYTSPYGHFKIHYDASGMNKPAYDNSKSALDNVKILASILDTVYRVEVDQFGYPPPPSDGTDGGDDLYDIYVENQPDYGGTQPDRYISDETYTSYMSIDNDYSNFYTKGVSGAKVTIAHELHHAIQMGNYAIRYSGGSKPEDLFFFEMTSTAMEEFVFDYVNDYYAYLKDYFNYPDQNFPQYDGYEIAIWDIFLRDRFGMGIIKKQWEQYKNERALPAINNSIAAAGSSFKRELNLFGIWSYYTGYRKKIAQDNTLSGDTYGYFDEGDRYPLIRVTPVTFSQGLFPINVSTLPMSNNFMKIINSSASPYPDTIVTIITNGNFSAVINSPTSFFDVKYSLYSEEVEGAKLMVNNYYYKIDSDNPDNYSDANVFNNKVVNGGEFLIVESDYVYPSPFYYKNSPEGKIYIPVAYNRNGDARLYIYTSDMNLVYEGIGKIITPNDKFVLEWNVRDSEDKKLSSGVYLYVTESEDTIKKGKIVIFSE